MAQFYCYIYIDPTNRLPFYVGKGKDKRAYVHLKGNVVNLHFNNKIKKLLRDDLNPIIHIINTRDEVEAFELEMLLIADIGRLDLGLGPLLNLTDGGDSGPSLPGVLNPMFGTTRKDLAEFNRTQKKGKQHIAGMNDGNHKHSKETRALISKNNRGSGNPMFGHISASRNKKWYHNPGLSTERYFVEGEQLSGYIRGRI
jgi:hypothetical protein